MKGKIFSTREVQAILSGSKVMFREVIKPQPNDNQKFICRDLVNGLDEVSITDRDQWDYLVWGDGNEIKCPYQVGQKIFCKEEFVDAGKSIAYKAKNPLFQNATCWKPAQHMKQEHSRLTLLIKEIRVERLADISREDCLLEGIESYYTDGAFHMGLVDEIEAFRDIWNATHKKPEEKFEANPWVWKVEMEVVKLASTSAQSANNKNNEK